jgi:peptidoglycan/xylan/chitin deacetylase (PgdA/CDA1 family)
MKDRVRGGLVAGVISILSGLASAPAIAGASADACLGRPGVLGLSRIVEIDTAGGPRFGSQYADAGFLEEGEVLLTFDDGPLRPYTRKVLDALAEQCVKATFFIVGSMAVADPETLKEIERRGHTIGIHTWSHKKLPAIGAAKAVDEIELGLSATEKALGMPVAPLFRFPYLRDSRATLAHLEKRNIAIFGIDIDSRDFDTRNPGEVQRTVLAQLAQRRKGIILMHDIQPSTAHAIRALLGELKARGYKVVHMVAKDKAVALPAYDAIAADRASRKLAAAAKNPLATRSVVWPATVDKAQPSPEPTEEELPWLTKTSPASAAAPTPRPPRRPEPPGLSENPWQIRGFGY